MSSDAEPVPGVRLTEVLPGALDGERLDRVVALLADLSRREATEIIRAGGVTVNGRPVLKPATRLEVDDEVALDRPERDERLEADPGVAFEVVHEDDDVLVVDKPAHLVVHPGSGVTEKTLVNGLLARYPELAGIGQPDRPGIVHRLDRGTSGLLMVARTAKAYEDLVAQLAARTVSRRYLAVVEGLVESDEGLIDAPLGRSPRRVTRRAVVADGRPARTRYRVDRRFLGPRRTYLECRLETGRTHQIRAHLSAIGHPVLADIQYDAAPVPELDRPFLHAAALSFLHPVTGRTVDHRSELPGDLQAVLDALVAAPDPDTDPGPARGDETEHRGGPS